MTTASALQPAPRVAPNLLHAFDGVWRLTFRHFLLPGHGLALAIWLLILAALCAGGPRHGRPDEFVGWAANFYVTFLVPALAFMAGAGAIRDEMKSSSIDYVLTRPVPRPAFVAFRFVAHTICAQLELLLALGVVLGFAASHEVPHLATFAAKLLFGQVLLVMAFSAFGFLCGVITSRYVLIGLAYAGIVEVGVGQIPTQLSRLSMTHQMRDMLGVLFHHTPLPAAPPGVADTAAILLGFTVLALGAAVVIFSCRELSGAEA
jgi:ABC-2 type transport system permease protein